LHASIVNSEASWTDSESDNSVGQERRDSKGKDRAVSVEKVEEFVACYYEMGCIFSSPSATPPIKTDRSAPTKPQDDRPRQAGGDAAKGSLMKNCYSVEEVIGSGAFSTVHRVNHRASRLYYAMKCVIRAKLTQEDDDALQDEVAILKQFDHVHIIKLYDFFVEPEKYYLVLEEMSGGELFDRIVKKSFYTEGDARDLCRFLLEAMKYCHDHNVAHRDLKPENLLLQNSSDDSNIKIADFGFAKRVKEPKSLTTQCGTPGYVAPEILKGQPYDEKADMWSVGVILYILLGGYPPFIEENQKQLFRKIKAGSYEFHKEYWCDVSSEAKNLISSLLTVNPDKRLSATESLQNIWISGKDPLANKDLGPSLERFKKFNAKRKLRAAVHTVIVANKMARILDFSNAIKEAALDDEN